MGSLGLSSSIDCSLPRQDGLLGAIRLRSWSFTRKRQSGASCIVCLWEKEEKEKLKQKKQKTMRIQCQKKAKVCLPPITGGNRSHVSILNLMSYFSEAGVLVSQSSKKSLCPECLSHRTTAALCPRRVAPLYIRVFTRSLLVHLFRQTEVIPTFIPHLF